MFLVTLWISKLHYSSFKNHRSIVKRWKKWKKKYYILCLSYRRKYKKALRNSVMKLLPYYARCHFHLSTILQLRTHKHGNSVRMVNALFVIVLARVADWPIPVLLWRAVNEWARTLANLTVFLRFRVLGCNINVNRQHDTKYKSFPIVRIAGMDYTPSQKLAFSLLCIFHDITIILYEKRRCREIWHMSFGIGFKFVSFGDSEATRERTARQLFPLNDVKKLSYSHNTSQDER